MPPPGRVLQCYYWKCCSQMKASWLWGRIFWGPAKASGVNGLALLCVVLTEWYIAQCWCFISITMTKQSTSKRIFLCGNIILKTQSCSHGNPLVIKWRLEKRKWHQIFKQIYLVCNDTHPCKKRNILPALFIFSMLVIQGGFKMCLKI